MKYIRTKDGRIIDTEKEYQPLQWAEQARDYALTIAEADTIEELCDMTIVVDDERPNNIFELEYGIDKEIINKYKDIEDVNELYNINYDTQNYIHELDVRRI